ncbi:signal transduction protein [Lacticaseibacillus camelliae DSM 22697 = JCM 13995]|uniref:Signal transduction protein n=1 Tax=Lacticaseibacillus camelliae DSM 22697 = JCM 13995 TaxID=1423730 RepID=A0A0R2FGY8_9LACO|nr:signal transduction protein [Lacticaseibacillus camelliae DSM 22697 = JCM 13995]
MITEGLIAALAGGSLGLILGGSAKRESITGLGLAAGAFAVAWGHLAWLAGILFAAVSAAFQWRKGEKENALVLAGLFCLAAAGTMWVGAASLAFGVILAAIIGLWRTQNHWGLRLIALGFVLCGGGALVLTTGWVQVVVAAATLLAAAGFSLLVRQFFAQQDAVFAKGLDQMMAQYSGEVQGLYEGMRGWRHDYHDHLQALKAHLDSQDTAAARAYLDDLEDKLDTVDTLVHSGNPMLDAILNGKLTLAERENIPTNVKAFVGATPLIQDLDLVVIVGNLMDNALEAIEAQPAGEKRRLRVYIAILKQQLYISITNTRPADQQIDIHYASTKNDKRGLGIRRINKLVAKYGGMINRQYEDEVFVTEIALPLSHDHSRENSDH